MLSSFFKCLAPALHTNPPTDSFEKNGPHYAEAVAPAAAPPQDIAAECYDMSSLERCLCDLNVTQQLHHLILNTDGRSDDSWLESLSSMCAMPAEMAPRACRAAETPDPQTTTRKSSLLESIPIQQKLSSILHSLLPALVWEYISRSSLIAASTNTAGISKLLCNVIALHSRQSMPTLQVPLNLAASWTCEYVPTTNKDDDGGSFAPNAKIKWHLIQEALTHHGVKALREDGCKKIKNNIYYQSAAHTMQFSDTVSSGRSLRVSITERPVPAIARKTLHNAEINDALKPWLVVQFLRVIRAKTLPLLPLLTSTTIGDNKPHGLFLCFSSLLALLKALVSLNFSSYGNFLTDSASMNVESCGSYRFPVDQELMMEIARILSCLLKQLPPPTHCVDQISFLKPLLQIEEIINLCLTRCEIEIFLVPVAYLLSVKNIHCTFPNRIDF